ncbi:MAG: hypothetical protein VXY23_22770 [Pseudomonadota bacterium]|nr:hypothetical protein [Pseudomonadota bacterium]
MAQIKLDGVLSRDLAVFLIALKEECRKNDELVIFEAELEKIIKNLSRFNKNTVVPPVLISLTRKALNKINATSHFPKEKWRSIVDNFRQRRSRSNKRVKPFVSSIVEPKIMNERVKSSDKVGETTKGGIILGSEELDQIERMRIKFDYESCEDVVKGVLEIGFNIINHPNQNLVKQMLKEGLKNRFSFASDISSIEYDDFDDIEDEDLKDFEDEDEDLKDFEDEDEELTDREIFKLEMGADLFDIYKEKIEILEWLYKHKFI